MSSVQTTVSLPQPRCPLPLTDLAIAVVDSLTPPKPGARLDLPALHGSGDALALAKIAAKAPLLILTAAPQDAQRLADELAWFNPSLRLRILPDWETLPYDAFSPHQDLISERLSTLYALSRGEFDVVLVPASTALYRMAPASFLAAYTFFLKQKERLDLDGLRDQMMLAGYSHVTQVVSPGEFSIRGGLIDLFPMGSTLPYRIDLFDDEIESIRTFDPDTQRTVYPVTEIRLLPAREFPLDEKARSHFRASFREAFEGDPSRSQIYKDVSNGIAPAGIEYYLPLFFEQTSTLFDYLPPKTLICAHGNVAQSIEEFWRDTQQRYLLLRGDRARPTLAPEQLFLRSDDFFSAMHSYGRMSIQPGSATQTNHLSAPLPDLNVERKAADPLHKLKAFCSQFKGQVILLAESNGRRETLLNYIQEYGLQPLPPVVTSPLLNGFALPQAGFAFITENELFYSHSKTRTRRDQRKAASVEGWLRDLSELKIGDPVVHMQHGIGRYLGLINMDMGDGAAEFLSLEYSGGDKLYVPVAQLQVITRYAGADPENVNLHQLGSGQWEKAKRKAAEQVRDTAAELLALYAQRAARQGYAFDIKTHDLDAFAEDFGFEETPDQLTAIEAVVSDMRSGKPMDRLVCGDVGFGKTEVALRAAFIAVQDGKQVAVLTPTTLLAEQHYQTFSDRFANWPVKVAEISRFKSAKEQVEALKLAAEGKIDILIGTHRLLQNDVEFKQLGLVIIDEEHRFGVRQKENFKKLRAEVDVLTLTATPIPRTLGMALEGLRDFSVISTAPQKRLAIKTFVQRYSKGIVREAVLREFKRGGQVYFLHNEVDTILNMRDALQELLPEARIVVGHGQLPERELERVMRDFTQQRSNLLLCSTIIETGINIPTANTIIINRADRFGLAQLHQLRGRVGRSHHQAYAYLLTDAHAKPTAQAQKRLEAISMMEELGSGFYLAMHDLEIRGAGEVLGDEQSGDIAQVGVGLFTEMLKRAVKSLQAGKEPDLSQPLEINSEINLHMPALLPNDYCSDVQERLTLYKRMANCEATEELQDIREELVDRFGELPTATQALLESHRLRITSQSLGIIKIDASEKRILFHFNAKPAIEPIRIIQLIQSQRQYKLAGQDKLSVEVSTNTLQERSEAIRRALRALQGGA